MATRVWIQHRVKTETEAGSLLTAHLRSYGTASGGCHVIVIYSASMRLGGKGKRLYLNRSLEYGIFIVKALILIRIFH